MIEFSHCSADERLDPEAPGWIVAKWDDGFTVVIHGGDEMLDDPGARPELEDRVQSLRERAER